MITVATLRSLLLCDPKKGTLIWRDRPEKMFTRRRAWLAWNTRYAGKPALSCRDARGYGYGSIFKQRIYKHRAIVAMVTGRWPKEVDHINGCPKDDRLDNLRVVTHAENGKNVKMRSNNKSGVCGVFWDATRQKWHAKIRVNGADKYIGYFSDLSAAKRARKLAEIKFGFHENHGQQR